jgi:predicted CXXCH cytochrome family protein
MQNRFVYLLLVITALSFWYCAKELPEAVKTNTYKNLSADVKYVGMNTCKSCHANIHATFIHTGMGRSFDRASEEKSDATYGDHALVYDSASNFYYKPFFKEEKMYVLEFRLDGQDTIHQRLEQINYIVGSGQHTNSHIVDINGYIYQAPITYYTQEGKWDMAPGYKGDNIRFTRLLATECITCHNHLPEFVEGSMNKYGKMPTGIECERCHGPGELHVKEKLQGIVVDTSNEVDYTIVNPRDLPRDLQMDLCQRCHLQGIAVLNEDKDFFDFRPGMVLSDVFNVFLPRYTDSDERFIMASQADRLRLSPCYQQSEMTCISCHNPHQSIEVTQKTQYNDACINCHQQEKTLEEFCTASQAERLSMGDDCSGCHMPPSGSIDIPHINITDHYISRNNTRGRAREKIDKGEPAFLGLKILTKDKASALEMTKAYLAMYDKYTDSPIMLDSAWHYLQQAQLNATHDLKTSVHYYFAREDFVGLVATAGEVTADEISDGWTAYRIGEGYYKSGTPEKALSFYQKAAELLPFHLDFQEKLGSTYLRLQQFDKGIETLEWVVKEHPKRPVALTNLGYAYARQGNVTKAEQLYNRAIDLSPDYEQALINKAAVRMYQRDMATAVELANRVLQINPENQQAQMILRQGF